MDLDYGKILKAALSRGGEYADLYIENTRPTAIMFDDGKVDKVVSGIETGAGLRVIIGFRTVYAYTNSLEEKALLELAGKISHACGEKGGDIVIDLREKKAPVEKKQIVFPSVAERIKAFSDKPTMEKLVAAFVLAKDLPYLQSPRIVLTDGKTTVSITVSLGGEAKETEAMLDP